MAPWSALRAACAACAELGAPFGDVFVLVWVGSIVGALAGLIHGLLENDRARESKRQVAAAALDIRLSLVDPGLLPRRSLRLARRSLNWMLWALPAVALGLPLVVAAMVELHEAYGVAAMEPLTVQATLQRDIDVAVDPPPTARVAAGTLRLWRFDSRPERILLRAGEEVVGLEVRVMGDRVRMLERLRGLEAAFAVGSSEPLDADSAFSEVRFIERTIGVPAQPLGWPWELPFLSGAIVAGWIAAKAGRSWRKRLLGPRRPEAPGTSPAGEREAA